MTIPSNPILEAAPYGAQPVLIVSGAQGGPYSVAGPGAGVPVGGDTPDSAVDAGSPVKIGGKCVTAVPAARATGQRGDAYFDPRGRQGVMLGSAGNDAGVATWGGSAQGSLVGLDTVSLGYAFNGTQSDPLRNNQEVTLLASASRTATLQSADQTNYNGKRLLLIVDVSVVGTGSITPSLQVKDPISGNYFTVWTAAAAVVTGATFAYLFEGGASGGSATEKLAFGLPARTWRVNVTHNNANAITYSVSANVGV